MQLVIQQPGIFEKTKENKLFIKNSFSRNAAKLRLIKKNSTNWTVIQLNCLKTSKTRLKAFYFVIFTNFMKYFALDPLVQNYDK